MPLTALKGKEGFTLVEVMVALVVLLLVFLALMQSALMSIDANMVNALRDEAVNVAEELMTDVRNTDFDTLAAVTTNIPLTDTVRQIRNIQSFQYTATRVVSDINTTSKQVVITVTWEWKDRTVANGTPYTHEIRTILRDND